MAAVESEWLTIDEVCAYLRITRTTLYRWARDGRLPLYKLGRRTTRVKRSDIDHFVSSNHGARPWTKLSEASFGEGWDNEKDAAYDKWRELYGLRQG